MQLFGNILTGNISTGNISVENISTENISIGRGVIILKIFDKKSNAFSFVNKKLSIDAPKRSGYIFFVSCKSLPKEESMKLSKVTAELLDYIQKGVSSSPHTVVRTVNALGSGPLAYRTFGGNVQNYAAIDEQALEKAFGSHYLLTMIAQGLIIRRILYPESGSCHTLYCDKAIYGFFARHGLLDCGVWSHVDYETLERNITPENTDYRIYYSYSKPDALLKEAELAGEQVPVFLWIPT